MKQSKEIIKPEKTEVERTTSTLNKYLLKKLKFEPHKYEIPGEYFKTYINKLDGRSISVKAIINVMNIGSLLGYCPLNSEINSIVERHSNLKSKVVSDELIKKMKKIKRKKIEFKNNRRKEQVEILSKAVRSYNKAFKKLSKKLKKMDFTLQEKGYGKSPMWFSAINKNTVISVQLQAVYYNSK